MGESHLHPKDAAVAAGQIEDVCKALDSRSQHRNFDAVQGRLSDSEIVTWVAIPHSIIRSDLIVYGLTSRIGRRNSRYHGDRVYQITAYSEIETESFKQLQLRTFALHTF